MTSTSRTRLGLAALALLVGSVTACGGDSGDAAQSAPDDASKAEFCDTYVSQMKAMAQGNPEEDAGAAVERMQNWAEEMTGVGTPKDMPGEARRGFETIVAEVGKLDAGASQRELEQLGEDLGATAEKEVAAFGEYTFQACPDALEEMMGGLDEELGGQMDELEGQLGDLQGDLEGELGKNLEELEQLTESPLG